MTRIMNKKQRGQVIVFMMFAMIPLMLLMATIFNGGYLLAQKTRLQNATDTSALMEASWTARSLNIMSMNNTAMTQSQAITSAGWAMEKPLMDAGLNAGLLAGFYVGRTFAVMPLYPPFTTIIAPLMYAAAYALMNNKVLNPLHELQLELKRAMHTSEDTGFAKASTSFGRMNKILKDKFPNSIEDYSKQLIEANYTDTVTMVRYTAWSSDESRRMDLDIPVIEQSFSDALSSIRDGLTDEGSLIPSLDSNTDAALSDALASIKDVRDVYHAGLYGTQTNPFEIDPDKFLDGDPLAGMPSLNYFGNFRAQGYPDGTGPFSAATPQNEEVFKELYDALESFRTGEFLGNMVGGLLRDNIPCPGFICNPFFNAIEKVIDIVFGPFLGSPYDAQATDPEDFKNRLTEVWEWSSYYGESHYSNSWDFLSGTYSLGPVTVSAPPRMWRGILPGVVHGRDLRTMVGSVGSVDEIIEDFKTEYAAECYEEKYDPEVARRKGIKKGEKEDYWDDADPKPRHQPYNSEQHSSPYMTKAEYSTLTPGEISAVESAARTHVIAECEEMAKDHAPDLPDIDMNAEPEPPPPGSGTDFNNAGEVGGTHNRFSDLHGEAGVAKAGGGGGGWQDPATVQKYLTMINWFFEPAYKAIDLPFPADAVLFGFIGDSLLGDGREETDPNLWCGKPFGEGFVCTNETPMYAVHRQRLLPEFVTDFAGDIAEHFDFDMDSIPDTISDNFFGDRDDWSLVVSATVPARMVIAPAGFEQVPTEMSTIAQAEVYNSQWYDLFTQTWKAKLTPISLLDDTTHFDQLTDMWEHELGYAIGKDILQPAMHDDERILNH